MESVGSAMAKLNLNLPKNMPPDLDGADTYVARKSETTTALIASLIAVQQELEPVPKDKENPFFNSRYADLGACMKAATAVYNKFGFAVLQRPLDTDGSTICIETILMHVSGEYISGILRLKPTKLDPQGLGSCLTYARRYALGAITGLVTEEDDDGNAASRPAALPKATTKPPLRNTPAQPPRPMPAAAPSPPPPPDEDEPELSWLPTASVGYLKSITKSKKLTQKNTEFGDLVLDLDTGGQLSVTWFGFSSPWTFETLRDQVAGSGRAVFFTVIPPSNPKYKPTLEHIYVEGFGEYNPDATQ